MREVWNLPSCERHVAEAEAAALAEMWENARAGTAALLEAERPRWRPNGALLHLLRAAEDHARGREEEHQGAQEEAARDAYGDADGSNMERETTAYNGDPCAGEPVEWWGETRRALCRSMREAPRGRASNLRVNRGGPARPWRSAAMTARSKPATRRCARRPVEAERARGGRP